jgi:6-phosphogluconate dehydrogenase
VHHLTIIITGVSGSGKTTIGKELARKTGIEFYDADDFHSKANIDKMSNSIPLTDEDRLPWLQVLNKMLLENQFLKPTILACSALRESYRQLLVKDLHEASLLFIHLTGSFDTIKNRLAGRSSHYMPSSLLKSQFDTYEPADYGLKIDVSLDIDTIISKILNTFTMPKAEIGIAGLGVMGTSLARNIAGKGFQVALFNRHVDYFEENITEKARANFSELYTSLAFNDLESFIASLRKPRKIILMVNAGTPVDEMLQSLKPLLEEGDLIIDGGNSHYEDTMRRMNLLEKAGLNFLGCGISGGEEGALKGPALMPGGSRQAYGLASDVLNSIAARNRQNEVCCRYVGYGGAGHFVKMVHNGIEYAEMQLIAEVISAFKDRGFSYEEIASVLAQWNQGPNQSYLLEITSKILLVKEEDGQPVLDKIVDSSGNKGTGSWTTAAACQLGVPVPTLTEALFARYVSSFRDLRHTLSLQFIRPDTDLPFPELSQLENSILFARIINHQQGLRLIEEASRFYNWAIDIPSLLVIWSGGCIIRSALIELLRESQSLGLNNFFDSPDIRALLSSHYTDFRKVCTYMASSNGSFPCFSAAHEYFKYLTTYRSNASIIQAQRDFFGAHKFERTDDPSGKKYHHQWY